MKKLLQIAIAAVMIAGCGEQLQNNYDKSIETKAIANNILLLTIDSCEYLELHTPQGVTLTHKGNCSNPIHYDKNKKP